MVKLCKSGSTISGIVVTVIDQEVVELDMSGWTTSLDKSNFPYWAQ